MDLRSLGSQTRTPGDGSRSGGAKFKFKHIFPPECSTLEIWTARTRRVCWCCAATTTPSGLGRRDNVFPFLNRGLRESFELDRQPRTSRWPTTPSATALLAPSRRASTLEDLRRPAAHNNAVALMCDKQGRPIFHGLTDSRRRVGGSG